MKKYIYISVAILLSSCRSSEPEKKEIKVSGYAQGTTYSVSYISTDGVSHQRAIDSLLIVIDNSMSTYNKGSLISKWNKSETGVDFQDDKHFMKVFNESVQLQKLTNGCFDPTVAPLVNAWGFGFEKAEEIDSLGIQEIVSYVGFENSIKVGLDEVYKTNPKVMLDFNAIAQGYTVDVLGDLLEQKGIVNYLVEVGGELKAKGNNMEDTLWRVGIDKPLPNLEEREIQAIVHLENKSLATSGNYRKFYEKNGMKYSHTINPKTGYPVEHNLLSATVVAPTCSYADAMATAFMVMGLEKSKEFLSEHPEVDALLIYDDQEGGIQTFISEGLIENIELNPNKN